MDSKIERKPKAFFELALMFLSIFAFAYLMAQTTPLLKTVSATSSFPGCCAEGENNLHCQLTLEDQCKEGAPFFANVLCPQTTFCQTGCCIDPEIGVCSRNAIQSECGGIWVDDSRCNVLQCTYGCCDLGSSAKITTQKECEIYTERFSLGDNKEISWDSTLSEIACIQNSEAIRFGACIYQDELGVGFCQMISETECSSLTSDPYSFNEGFLCTSPEIGSPCEKTEKTTCLEGHDQVFYLDSCGNPANIYDGNKFADPDYWNRIIPVEETCGAGDGNENSETCGNCNRFLGGICEIKEGGGAYCKTTDCVDSDGKIYKNGESWCVYESTIGDGNDVVGSRHYRKICSMGEVQLEPCADYRQEICVQSDLFEGLGTDDSFKNAFCRINNWRNCIISNGEDTDVDTSFDCVTKKIEGGNSYNVEFTAPAYPTGFWMGDSQTHGLSRGQDVCAIGSFNCTYLETPKTWGGCEIADGDYCKKPETLAQMNDFCRSLGDCGMSANVVGKVEEGCKVKNSNFASDYSNFLRNRSLLKRLQP